MAKDDTKGALRKERTTDGDPERPRRVVEVVIGARENLFDLSIETGLQVLEALLEEDRDELVGPTGRHDAGRTAYRGGHDGGVVVLGGRKIAVRKPRARAKGGRELRLPT